MSTLNLPPWTRWTLPRLPTTQVCGVDVAIDPWLPPGWFGTVEGQLIAHSEAAAEAWLSRILWTSPPCFLAEDGTLIDAEPPAEPNPRQK